MPLDGKEVVLKIGQGFMCGYSLKRLYNFTPRSDDPHFVGMELATRFAEAGISIPKDLFVLIFDRFTTEDYT